MGRLTTYGISGTIAAIPTGFLVSKISSSVLMLMAMMAFTAAIVVLATTPVHGSYRGHIFISCIIMPWGMDISFPAGTLMLSNAVSHENQGLAASLVNMILNYSISLGLGVAGTVASRTDPQNNDLLWQYRTALYSGIGMGGLGIFAAGVYVIYAHSSSKRAKRIVKEDI
jgi:predicted MFS family arabinose efflux permease